MKFINQHPILSLSWITLLAGVIFITLKSSFSKVKEISYGEATHLINKEDAIVIDIRSREDYHKGHIANSVNLTPSDLKNANLGELEKHKTRPIIVACAHGNTSFTHAENLNKVGFERVFTLKGGISGWRSENLPLVRSK